MEHWTIELVVEDSDREREDMYESLVELAKLIRIKPMYAEGTIYKMHSGDKLGTCTRTVTDETGEGEG